MTSRYDRAITVFSPDGHLFQVEYAMEAVKKGTTSIGVRGRDAVVLAVERRTLAKLQDPRPHTKIASVDEHIAVTFAGLNADARVLVRMARLESQSYQLTLEESPTVSYMSRYVAMTQQKYTQSGGVRPFAVSVLLAGFDHGKPKLLQTDPSGTYTEWKAMSIGRNSRIVNDFLQANYTEEAVATEADTVKLALRALLETVESSKMLEVGVLRDGGGLAFLPQDRLDELVKEIKEAQTEAPALA